MIDTTTAEQWAGQINQQATKTVAAVIEVGRLLIAAKAALPHGEFLRMFAARLVTISPTSARRLMLIAKHGALANEAFVPHLPAAWSVLYQLSKLPAETVSRAIEAGHVTPAMTQQQALALRLAPRPAAEATAPAPIEPARTAAGRAARLIQIGELAHDGYTPHQIAAAVGLKVESVRVLIRRHGIHCPGAMGKAQRRIDPNQFVDQIATGAENLLGNLDLIDFAALDGARLGEWIATLKSASSALHGLIRQLLRERDRYVSNEESGESIEGAPGVDPVDASTAGARGSTSLQ